MPNVSAAHQIQYSNALHQEETAVSGMWLFLATEVLFFGALFLAWIYARHWDAPGFDFGGQQTNMAVGTTNTLILITSSLVYSMGIAFITRGNCRGLLQCCVVVWLLGAAFLVLKFGVEWRDDLARHLFPNASFAIDGPLRDGAKTFFVFYFFGTAIHGLHMVIGLALVSWVVFRISRRDLSASYFVPAVVVGLYWSFVDMVWLILYPLIYLIGRGT